MKTNIDKDMIDVLSMVENGLINLLRDSKSGSMYIDYHKPFVSRIWMQWGEYRIFLHKIEPCNENTEALYHPHRWVSAVKIIKGKYEMGVGHSLNTDIPNTDCRLILPQGSVYEMTDRDAWHYVNPIDCPVYSIMVTGQSNKREMPIEPNKTFRKLTHDECSDIIYVFDEFYNWDLSDKEISDISNEIINK